MADNEIENQKIAHKKETKCQYQVLKNGKKQIGEKE